MKKNLIQFLLFAVMSVCSTVVLAQTTVKGQLVDDETGEPLVGAAVMVEGSTQGSVTDIDGYFKQDVKKSVVLVFKYVGYKDLKKRVEARGKSVDLGRVAMKTDAVMLKDVVITSSVAVARKTPVALSTVDPVFIEEKLGTQEFPEILKSTPGVYATKNGGGYGDSKINMRGFQAANIGVMINGVPVNDMEWGGIYWSNWAGLSDVTRSMQTQRGLGASKVSSPSVGGTINIVTRTTDQKKGGSVAYGMGNDGMQSILFNVSSGLTKSGWAFTILGGRRWGDGYIQGTEYEGYNWFVNISKQIGDSHTISLTGFGAPQWHNQRSNYDGLTIQGWQDVRKYMPDGQQYRYNPTYGFDKNGQRRAAAKNFYHKPQISLNHQWQINDKSSLSTALYVSIGEGGGNKGLGLTSTDANNWYGANNGVLNTAFRKADGTFAYDEIQELNEQSTVGSQMVMSKSKNSHRWYGLLSTYTTKINENIDFYGGIDYRYYKGIHTNEITDLYSGEYYTDSYYRKNVKAANNPKAADPNWKYEKLGVGDVVYRDYDGYVMSEGAFFQLEYNKDKIAAFVAGSISNTGYWRRDRFYYDNQKSETLNFLGYTIKGGANYNLNDNHNVFFNVGYISRAPFFSGGAFLQSTVSNETNPDAINEKIFSAEVGYGFKNKWISANLNAYFTKWLDKTTTRSSDYTTADGETDRYMFNMSGVNAKHMGVELDVKARPTRWLELTGMLSVGDWKWDSDASGYFYNSAGQPLKDLKGNVASGIAAEDHAKFTLKQKGIKVGGSAQTTAAIGANVNVMKGLRVGMDWTYFGNNYADYSLSSSNILANSEVVVNDPWKIPAGYQFDLNASYKFNIGNCKATLSGNVNNLFDYQYIVDAYDGGTGKWQDAYRVFYAFGRTYTVRLKVNF